MKAKSGKTGVGGKKNPNKSIAVVKKPGGRVGGTNASVKVKPAPGKKGINKK
jgi:hypothetical protein